MNKKTKSSSSCQKTLHKISENLEESRFLKDIPLQKSLSLKPLSYKETINQKADTHHIGHRRRLREKYFQLGKEAITDYEFLEIILSLSIPRIDVKPLSKSLLKEFKDIPSIFHASDEKLLTFKGLGEKSLLFFKVFKDSAYYMLKNEITKSTILSSWTCVCDYARLTLGHLSHEEFHIWFLDKQYHLLEEYCAAKGTLDHATIYPREILKKALNITAHFVILVHNHPSGDTSPSGSDIALTNKLEEAFSHANMVVLDHIIVGRVDITSFKNLGLL